MKQRARKKWLKKHDRYIEPKELWNLDCTIAEFILPRLIQFRKHTIGYPGYDEAYTMDKWREVLLKMITAFGYIATDDDWWINNPKYDYSKGLHVKIDKNTKTMRFDLDDWAKGIEKNQDAERDRRNEAIKEGLELFSKYFKHLWW